MTATWPYPRRCARCGVWIERPRADNVRYCSRRCRVQGRWPRWRAARALADYWRETAEQREAGA